MSLITKSANKVLLGIGSYASLNWKFLEKDVRYFADFIGDKNLVHFDQESLQKLGFEKPFVYGMMPTSLLSKLYLSTFISPIYLSQSVNFMAPIYVDEEIELKIVVSSLEETKKKQVKCTLNSTVTKIEKNAVAVTGTGLLLLDPESVEIIK